MTISQSLLDTTIIGAPADLDTLTRQRTQISLNITGQTNLQNMYLDMMSLNKTNLEAKLLTKVQFYLTAWTPITAFIVGDLKIPTVPNSRVYECTNAGLTGAIEPLWTTTVGDVIVDGGAEWTCRALSYAIYKGANYLNGTSLSDWAIVSHLGVPANIIAYAYSTETVSVWAGFGTGGVTEALHNVSIRTRIVPTVAATSIRIRINSHETLGTQIFSAYIGERSGATADVVAGTNQQVFFNGGQTSAILKANVTQYSDWMSFNIDPLKTYFFSAYLDSCNRSNTTGGRTYFIPALDRAATEAWSAVPEYIGTTETEDVAASLVQGYEVSPTWDGDAEIIRWVGDWNVIYPLVYASPFGTSPMLTALGSAYSLINTRRTQIANRNPILIDFKTYPINIYSDGPGTVSPAGPLVTVDRGSNLIVVFTPTVGHVVSYFVLDGENRASLPSYTFSNVTDEHSIKVYFV